MSLLKQLILYQMMRVIGETLFVFFILSLNN